MEYKKFRSPDKPIFISSTSGHSVSLHKELQEVPSILWAEAYAAGAISEDMQVSSMSSYLAEKEKEVKDQKNSEREELKKVLLGVYKNPVGFVDKDNRPLTRRIIGLINKPVKKDLVDSVWDEILSELPIEE